MSNANAHTPGPTNLDRLLSDLASGNDDDRSVADSCRFELEQIRDELTDWRDGAKRAASETCGDEVHCTCVPTLRVERAALLAALQEAAELLECAEFKDSENAVCALDLRQRIAALTPTAQKGTP